MAFRMIWSGILPQVPPTLNSSSLSGDHLLLLCLGCVFWLQRQEPHLDRLTRKALGKFGPQGGSRGLALVGGTCQLSWQAPVGVGK